MLNRLSNRWVGLKRAILILFLFVLTNVVFPQSFGKNKVQYRNFGWKYLQSKHFDVYYYGDEKHLAEFVADVAETFFSQQLVIELVVLPGSRDEHRREADNNNVMTNSVAVVVILYLCRLLLVIFMVYLLGDHLKKQSSWSH